MNMLQKENDLIIACNVYFELPDLAVVARNLLTRTCMQQIFYSRKGCQESGSTLLLPLKMELGLASTEHLFKNMPT